jgi:diketogulonate reductase-like aldo/keto reductase
MEEMVDKGKVRNIGISKCVLYTISSMISRELTTLIAQFQYCQVCCFHTAHIGVIHMSVLPNRMKNLTANPLKYQPAVNQVELSYWIPQPELIQVYISP